MVRFGEVLKDCRSRAESVSIPVWCDLERAALRDNRSRRVVSIPVWCDLELITMMDLMLQLMFQFQYGAIWRFLDLFEQVQAHLFQFQYGAIWSLMTGLTQSAPLCFNSSMVRFGDASHMDNLAYYACFNSSMVRFGDNNFLSKYHLVNEFQFQYGAIWRKT